MKEIICDKAFAPHLKKISCLVITSGTEVRVFTNDPEKAQDEAERLCKGYKLIFI